MLRLNQEQELVGTEKRNLIIKMRVILRAPGFSARHRHALAAVCILSLFLMALCLLHWQLCTF